MEFAGKKVVIKLTMGMVRKTLPDRLDMNLLDMFDENEQIGRIQQRLILDDQFALDVMWTFFEDKFNDLEEFNNELDKHDNLHFLDTFRDEFWQAVVNFSGPLKRSMLEKAWKMAKKEIREVDLEGRLEQKLNNSSSGGQLELDL